MGLRPKVVSKTIMPNDRTPSRTKTSRDEQLIRKAMQVHDAERERFVESLKASVWDGSYNPSAEEIADAMIAERCQDRATDNQDASGSLGH